MKWKLGSYWESLTVPFLVILLECIIIARTAPQYDGAFIKTNVSRKVGDPIMNDPHHSHRERHHETHTTTSTGDIRGLRRTVLGKEVFVYYGIPFAEPPINELRFKKPVPIKPWSRRLDATTLQNSCMQERYESFDGFQGEEMWNPNTPVSEDCLYLNLFVPKAAVTKMKLHLKTHNKLDDFKGVPILIWIYGGGYMAGTNTLDIYNADVLSGENNVIVAAMNYRVGALGFLYMGIEDAPGNQGMYDQVVAMKWIKDNALRFGGDPNSITVFGESAGGGSVSFHIISPLSRDLLTRGILQSGTINAPWSVMNASEAHDVALQLAIDCGCNETKTHEETIACLREQPAKKLSELQWNGYKSILAFPSAPTIDGEFLPKHPLEMLKEGDFKKTELLIGSNQNEGTYFVLYDFLDYFNKDAPSCLSREKFREIINKIFPNKSFLEKEAILFQYTHWEDVGDQCKNSDLISELVGDYFFICPTNLFANAFSDHGLKVYYYFFTQRTSSNPWGDWMGVIHGEEVEYVFGQPLKFTENHTISEIDLSRRVMKYFVRFAETGNPADESSDEVWPLYTRDDPRYFILNGDVMDGSTGKGPRAQACAFWNDFMPLITPGTTSLPNRCSRERWDINSSSRTKFSMATILLSLISVSIGFLASFFL